MAQDRFGNRDAWDSQTNFDSRVRLNFTGTAAGGTYVKARLRMEGGTGDIDNDPAATADPVLGNNNLWADMAYIGIPFTDNFTVETGRYRSTYGPVGPTYNFAYDDVSSMGAKGIIKVGKDVVINPFIEYMEETQGNATEYAPGTVNQQQDNDEIRYGVHAKVNINKDWFIGGMLAYQSDDRPETWNAGRTIQYFEPNEGMFGSIYVSGKSGNFGLVAELAFTEAELNNFNSWEVDTWTTANDGKDLIGSEDTGFGGYVYPTFKMDKLTLGLNLGFTTDGYQPDRAFGSGVMIGSADNSRISAIRVGDFGDWLWGALIAQYQINESLKLTGNFVYADIDAWNFKGVEGDGPNTSSGSIGGGTATSSNPGITGAWELSAILQYTISKGTDVFFSAGYLQPDTEGGLNDDGVFGALTRLEVKF
jgi:hypothetical protein